MLTSNSKPESFTSYYFVEPLLSVLGYTQIIPEGGFEDESKRRYVDYLVAINESSLLIEAKPLGAHLHGHNHMMAFSQIKDYMKLLDESIGIVTNGLQWSVVAKDPNSKKYCWSVFDLRYIALDIMKCQDGEVTTDSFKKVSEFVKKFSRETILNTIHEMFKQPSGYSEEKAKDILDEKISKK